MSTAGWRRFWIGGGGALLPLLVTLLVVDLSAIIDNAAALTVGKYVGAAIRYVALFLLGGIIATLHTDETKPIKLVQLGIAAPALVSSFINANGAAHPNVALLSPPAITTGAAPIGFIGTAHAADSEVGREPSPGGGSIRVAGFFGDLTEGLLRPLPRKPRTAERPVEPAQGSNGDDAASSQQSGEDRTGQGGAADTQERTRGLTVIDEDPVVRRAQQYLVALGFDVSITGVADPDTAGAISSFKGEAGLPADDIVDKEVLDALKAALLAQPDPL